MRLLAIKTHAAGDLLLITPALRALRRSGDDVSVILLTGQANAQVAQAIPGIDAYLFVKEGSLFRRNPLELYKLLRNIKRSGVEKAVIFQPSPRLTRFVRLAGIPVYAPFRGTKPPRRLAGGVPWRPNADKYIAENYVEVAEAAGGGRDDLRLDFVFPKGVPNASEITGLRGKKKYVALAPSGGRNPREKVVAKLPPAYFFGEIIDFILGETGRPVVIIGGPGDVERCAAVAAKTTKNPIVNIAGKTNVFECARVIEKAAYVITIDSLPMHIAVALQKPTLALFGPTNPQALLPPHGPVTAVAAELECAPCYANSPFPSCKRPFKYECRERIPLAPVKEFILQRG
ncbi:MAG TPA: glycosyltransferase family 9 protein [bacterium]|nr:glycosyltransferase family 9 protein [bacterium]